MQIGNSIWISNDTYYVCHALKNPHISHNARKKSKTDKLRVIYFKICSFTDKKFKFIKYIVKIMSTVGRQRRFVRPQLENVYRIFKVNHSKKNQYVSTYQHRSFWHIEVYQYCCIVVRSIHKLGYIRVSQDNCRYIFAVVGSVLLDVRWS